MAGDSSDDKTEDATPRRLREAREKGQIAKSKDLETVFVLIVFVISIALLMAYFGGEMKQLFILCFDTIAQPTLDNSTFYSLGKACLMTAGKILAPLMVAAVFIAILIGFIQAGGLFTMDPLIPKFEKLNPIEGLKNMFKIMTFIELAKNMVKIFIVFYLAYSAIYKALPDVLMSSKVPILDSAKITGNIILEFLIKVCIAFIFISAIDYAVQRWNYLKNMRMSKDEVKREYKQDEGDPHIKGERRRLHREMAFSDAKQAVKSADAVVTNPIHVACVIEYKRSEMSAPTLTLKGQRDYAQFIIDLAREENIPIIRNIPLAWSLVALEEGSEIPEDLYEGVAEVLTLVYEMKQEAEKKQAAVIEQKKPQSTPFI